MALGTRSNSGLDPVTLGYYRWSMKTAISLPDPLAEATDRLAERLGMSRSGVIQLAVTRLLEEFDDETVTARLDAVYGGHPDAGVDSILQALQAAALPVEEW
jgi:predicted DNA-binding protein